MAGGGGRQQLLVAGDLLGRGVEPVGQQGEPEVAVAVGEVVDLQAADLRLDLGLAGQQRRHDDQGPQLGRHAVVELEPGQRAGPEHVGDGPIDT